MSRPLNRGKQTHLEVPSSNEPLPSEWGKALWYVCRLAALQARADLSEDDAARLVGYFESLHTVIPCKVCRGHYAEYFKSSPYTASIALSTLASMTWVEDLRVAVDARIKAERESGSGSGSGALASVPVPVPVPTFASRLRRSNVSAPQRKYAIQSALQISHMNHTGRKIGCNCGNKK